LNIAVSGINDKVEMIGHQYVGNKFRRPFGFQVLTHLKESVAGYIVGEELGSIDQVSGYEMKSAG